MTHGEKFTAAELAQLDQHLADYRRAVDGFVDQAHEQVQLDGPSVATAVLADHVAEQLDDDQLAAVAAIALVRLADRTHIGTEATRALVSEYMAEARTWRRIAVQLAQGNGTYQRLTTVDRDRLEAALVDAEHERQEHAGAAVLGALAVGFQGVGEAIKSADDPEMFAEALENLSPKAPDAAAGGEA